MTSDRQRTYTAKMRAAGWKRIPVWLDAETVAALDRLTASGRSAQDAIRRAIKGAVK